MIAVDELHVGSSSGTLLDISIGRPDRCGATRRSASTRPARESSCSHRIATSHHADVVDEAPVRLPVRARLDAARSMTAAYVAAIRVWLNRGRDRSIAGVHSDLLEIASVQAALIAAGSDSLMIPCPSTMRVQSPTSVATGTAPHIMPSMRHSGAASPLDEVKATTSAAA